MVTKIISIGNSKGIRIPNNVLKTLHLNNQIDMIVDEQNEEIILRPLKKVRENWDKDFKMMHKNKDDSLLIDDTVDLEDNDWTW